MNFIELKNVSKAFNGKYALKDLNLKIDEGKVVGILGKSGAGKSVLINMLRGMRDYKPTEGSVIYNIAICPKCMRVEPPSYKGKDCLCGGKFKFKKVDFWNCDRKLFAAIRKRTAIMLQRTFALYEDEPVIDNVIKAIDELEYEKSVPKAIELLEMVQLTHRITHIARDLSGGEKQRVVLARQLAKNPMLFLADEPTGTLDPRTADLVHSALVKGVKEKNITMVVTSHWPEVMKELPDYVVWLDEGEVVEEGDPETVVGKFLEHVPELKERKRVEFVNPIIKVRNLKKHYYSIERGMVKAVDGVSFDVYEGEIFGIVGLSGAGKTTLSRMIAGLTDPSDGDVCIRLGDEWINMKEKGPTKRGRVIPYIGILHQEFSLYPHRTILENLTDAINLELPAEFARMKAVYVLKAVGFNEKKAEELLHKMPDELSGGERHRVALAQVLIKEPKIVILDEPTGTMDPITRIQVSDSILKSREELDQTYIIVSHDMDFVLEVCDRAALMRGGKILKIGNPEDIVEELTPEEKKKMSVEG